VAAGLSAELGGVLPGIGIRSRFWLDRNSMQPADWLFDGYWTDRAATRRWWVR
jgi:hypothetical protein